MPINLHQYWSAFEQRLLALNASLTAQNIDFDEAYHELYQLSLKMIPIGKDIENMSYSDKYTFGNQLENERPTFDGKGPGQIKGPASYALAKLYLEHIDLILSGEVVSSAFLIRSAFSLKRIIPETDKTNLSQMIRQFEQIKGSDSAVQNSPISTALNESFTSSSSNACLIPEEDWVWVERPKTLIFTDWAVVLPIQGLRSEIISLDLLEKLKKRDPAH